MFAHHQGTRTERCELTAKGIAYWSHIPSLLPWSPDRDYDPCPLAEPNQLVRNVLAATVREGRVRADGGHALLVYDDRKPAVEPRANGSFEQLRAQLTIPSALRRCSWQRILGVMADYDELRWLVGKVGAKYGLLPSGQQGKS